MSDTIIIAIIGLVGGVLGAAIGAFGTIEAAKVKAKSETNGAKSDGASCAVIGLAASVAAVIGLALGVLYN